MSNNLDRVRTRDLPPGYARVRFPADRLGEFYAYKRANGIEIVGDMTEAAGTVYAVVRQHRAAPAWQRPALIGGGVTVGLALLWYAVSSLVDASRTVWNGLGPAFGFLVVLAVVILIAAARRGRKGKCTHTVTVTCTRR
jgi:hypothetical protein